MLLFFIVCLLSLERKNGPKFLAYLNGLASIGLRLVVTELEYRQAWGCGMTAAAKNIDRNRHPRTPPHPDTVSLSIQGWWSPCSRISRHEATTARRLWHAAGQLTHDLNLGIHVTEGIRPGALGALGYALRTSETMGMALRRLCRYHRFLHHVAEVKLTVAAE